MSSLGGGGGGGACCAYCCCCWYCSCSYCCCSWAAQRLPCRRETRFDTAVAVPAMAAVRATPRMSPGMGRSSSGSGLGLEQVELGEDGLHRYPAAGHQLGAVSAQCPGERRRPRVLVDENGGRAAGFQGGAGLVEVPTVDQAGGCVGEHRHVELALEPDIRDVDPHGGAVRVLLDERQVEHTDDPLLLQVDQEGQGRAVRWSVGRELDDRVVDGTELVEVDVAHVTSPSSCLRSWSVPRSGRIAQRG